MTRSSTGGICESLVDHAFDPDKPGPGFVMKNEKS